MRHGRMPQMTMQLHDRLDSLICILYILFYKAVTAMSNGKDILQDAVCDRVVIFLFG